MKKNRLNIRTFLSISITIMVLGFIGVNFSVEKIRQQYLEIQLESNHRTAQTIAKLFDEKLGSGIKKEELIKSFQSAIEGSNSDEGYLCMFDQKDGVLLCHPDTSAIGMSINSDKMKFLNLNGMHNELLFDAVSTTKEEYGILSFSEPARSEIAYMVPVPGTTWKISVHENLDKAEKLLTQLRLVAFSGFIFLSLFISLIATWAVRKISRMHEKEIELKNRELEQNNNELINLNHQIENQHAIISKHAENLEYEVKKRTAELESIYSKLADLEKSKSDFLAIISHELRTPLNGIIGFSNILEQELENEDHLEFVTGIRISGDRLLKFSETALLVTQLKVQSSKMEFHPIAIRDTILEVLKSFDEVVQDKHLKIIFEIQPESGTLFGVVDLIKQCFRNIFENAMRHAPENGLISINSFQEAGHICVTIHDNGKGFSDEALLRQFDLFGADDISHHSEGYGLGLVAARLIMLSHSGDIQIDNQADGGALVTLKFQYLL
jgi:two-component system sensor histidine kinase/response regulator